MGDTGYSEVDRPRPDRVVVGAVACIGLLAGAWVANARYDFANTMQPDTVLAYLNSLPDLTRSPLWFLAGVAVLVIGTTALIRVFTRVTTRWFGIRFGRRSSPPGSLGGPTPPSVIGQRGPSYSRRYFDPKFTVVTEVNLNEAMQRLTAGFEQLEFESPLVIDVIDDDRLIPSTVQAGCQDLALAIVETIGETTRPRLISILEDGFVIITVPSGDGDPRSGDGGTIEVADSDDPVILLSAHLDRIAAVAEERSTAPVTLTSSEWRDVYLVAGRVLADIRYRHGESNRCASEAVHGRFPFPPAPKQPLASCAP